MTPDEAIRLLRATLDALEPVGGRGGYRRDGIARIVIDDDGVTVEGSYDLLDWLDDGEGVHLVGNAAAHEPLRTRRVHGTEPVPVQVVEVTP